MGRRIRWLGLVLVLCFALIIFQLVNVQYLRAHALNTTRDNPRNLVKRYDNPRGLILAATGTVLAQTKTEPGGGVSSYKYYRTYPTGPLFAGVVGYTSRFYGTKGVERTYDSQLVQHTQSVKSIGELFLPPPDTTDNVTLTLHKTLQIAAQQALAAVPDTNKDGAVVVLNPKTGAVLAMYSSPAYNPNTLVQPNITGEKLAGVGDFGTKDHEGFFPGRPMATYKAFLPGSTFKVVTSTAVYNLDPSLINFNYPVQGCTAPGSIPTTTKQICNDGTSEANASPCGGTMVQMLPQSCDPGYATLGLKLGATNLYKQATAFGYDSVPPIDLTHTTEVGVSNFPTPTELSPGHTPGPSSVAYSAFGQETVSATALQNAMVAAGIADTGVVMTPHVMAQIHNSRTGALVESYQPSVYKTAASASAAQSVKKLMQGVVTTPQGTAAGVGFAPQDDVAVKTGTAQLGLGTAAQGNVDWMIGLAPASNPTVAIAVVVPYQATYTTGAKIAGPIMKAMITATLAEQARHPSSTTPPTSTTTTTTAPPAHHFTTPSPPVTATTTPATTTPTTTPPATTTPTTATTVAPPPATGPGGPGHTTAAATAAAYVRTSRHSTRRPTT